MKKTVSNFIKNQSTKILKGLSGFSFLIVATVAVRNSDRVSDTQSLQSISRFPAAINCFIFRNWKEQRSNLVNILSPKQKSEAIESEYRESIALSQSLYQKYLNHEYNPNL